MSKMGSGGKSWLWIAVVLALLIGLWSAKEEKENALPVDPSDEQILADVYLGDQMLQAKGLTVTDFTISNQRTSGEGRKTAFRVSYEAENNEALYLGELMLSYELADKSWVKTESQKGDASFKAKLACDSAVPMARLQTLYSDSNTAVVLQSQQSAGENECTFVYTVTRKPTEICTLSRVVTVHCVYDLWDGWYVERCDDKLVSAVWDICGSYTLHNEDLSATVNVTGFEIDIPNNRVYATLSYSFTSYQPHDDIWGGPVMQQGMTYYSEAPFTVDLGTFAPDYNYELQIGDILMMHFCGAYAASTDDGDGVGIFVEIFSHYSRDYGEYWLYRQ